MSRSRVIGLDLSLSSTGVAGYGWTDRIRPGLTLRGVERLHYIREQIVHHLGAANGVDLVVIEGPSYGSQAGQQGHHERAGLWWLVRHQLWRLDVDVAVVSPSALKLYATGKGNASKDEVLTAACRTFPAYDIRANDEADSLWLCAMGFDYLEQALVQLPTKNRAALNKVNWPSALEGAIA